jgi:hypothetical protein
LRGRVLHQHSLLVAHHMRVEGDGGVGKIVLGRRLGGEIA